MYLGNAATEWRVLLHLGDVVQKEKKLAVTGARNHSHFLAAFKICIEAGVKDILFAAHLLGVSFPTLAVRRIGKHKVELAGGMLIERKRGAKTDVLCLITVALQEHVGSANRIGFRIDFLPEEMDGYILATSTGQRKQTLLCNSEHTAGSAGSVVAGICSILNLIGHRHENEISHELNNVTRSPVFTSFLIVFFVETSDQLLEDGTHAVVIQTRMAHDGFGLILPHRIRAQVNVGGHKFLNDGTEDISIHHRVNLIAKFELIQNDLHIRREAIQISDEVCLERLPLCTAREVP